MLNEWIEGLTANQEPIIGSAQGPCYIRNIADALSELILESHERLGSQTETLYDLLTFEVGNGQSCELKVTLFVGKCLKNLDV